MKGITIILAVTLALASPYSVQDQPAEPKAAVVPIPASDTVPPSDVVPARDVVPLSDAVLAGVADSTRDARFVDDLVAAALEGLSQQLREQGLDPFVFDQYSAEYQLPVETLLSVNFLVENVVVTGLSNIVINNINYGLLSQRLTLDISLPEISFYLGDAALEAVILNTDINVNVNGRLSVIEPRISGEVRLNLLGIISGSLIRDVDLNFDLGALLYFGRVNVLGLDLSDQVSQFVSQGIPNAIARSRNDISELIEIVVRLVADQIL